MKTFLAKRSKSCPPRRMVLLFQDKRTETSDRFRGKPNTNDEKMKTFPLKNNPSFKILNVITSNAKQPILRSKSIFSNEHIFK